MIRFAFKKLCWVGLDPDQSWHSVMDTKKNKKKKHGLCLIKVTFLVNSVNETDILLIKDWSTNWVLPDSGEHGNLSFIRRASQGFCCFCLRFLIMERIKPSLWRTLLNSCLEEYELIWSILFQRLACTRNCNKLLGWPKRLFRFFLKMFMEKPEGIFFPSQYCPMMSYLSFCVVNMTTLKLWVVLKKRLKKKILWHGWKYVVYEFIKTSDLE